MLGIRSILEGDSDGRVAGVTGMKGGCTKWKTTKKIEATKRQKRGVRSERKREISDKRINDRQPQANHRPNPAT